METKHGLCRRVQHNHRQAEVDILKSLNYTDTLNFLLSGGGANLKEANEVGSKLEELSLEPTIRMALDGTSRASTYANHHDEGCSLTVQTSPTNLTPMFVS
jgi:hypothetical protein